MVTNKNNTLQQELELFYRKNNKLFSKKSISVEGEEFLRCHDIAHIVFGCDTSLYGEGLVKIWTTFGTTLSFWKVITGYKEANALELFRMYSIKNILANIINFIGVIPKTIGRAKNMSKPWPFTAYESYLNVPISAIRKEFNIKVIP